MFSRTSVTNSYKKSQVFGPWRTSHQHFLGLLRHQNTAEESVKERMSVTALLKCHIQDLTSGQLMVCIRFSISAQATVCWMHPDVQAELSRHHAAAQQSFSSGKQKCLRMETISIFCICFLALLFVRWSVLTSLLASFVCQSWLPWLVIRFHNSVDSQLQGVQLLWWHYIFSKILYCSE